jgi:alkanesulfonate monooxygenase SsuD/methylene tetrahydromethanopterin reductase-like flavin-dependent oxidoreductase (luciferase family)
MKFATFLYQTQPSSLAAIARKAEELGYESLWIPEHIILPVNVCALAGVGATW